MKEFCPNKKSKEFKELASIFGEDKAYFLWMRNKGNELDKAPNGAESRLFDTLLKEFNGDRIEALKAKAKVYSNEFINWFGDWAGIHEFSIESAKQAILDTFNEGDAYSAELNTLREIVEEDGKDITFEQAKNIFDAIRRIAIRDEKVPGTSDFDKTKIVKEAFGDNFTEKTYFAVDTKQDVQFDLPSDEDDAKIELYNLNKKHPELNLKLESFENIDKKYFNLLDEFISLVKQSDFFQNIYDLVDYAKKATNEQQSLKNVSKVVDENGEPLVVFHTVNPNYNADIRIFDTNIEGIPSMIYSTDDKEMSKSYSNRKSAFRDLKEVKLLLNKRLMELKNNEDWIKQLQRDDLGYTEEKIKDLGYFSKKDPDFVRMREYNLKEGYSSRKGIINDIQQLEFILSVPESIEYTKLLFVNIKHPFVLDANGLNWDELSLDENLDPSVVVSIRNKIKKRSDELQEQFEEQAIKDGKIDPFEASVLPLEEISPQLYYTIQDKVRQIILKEFKSALDQDLLLKTRDIEDLYRDVPDYDGIIFKNIKDWGGFAFADTRVGHNVFAAKQSNQIKSAIKNKQDIITGESGFSTEDYNIYHNLAPISAAAEMRQRLADRGLIHSFRGDRITKRISNARELICKACEDTTVLPFFYEGVNSTEVQFLDNVTISQDLRDEIERSNDKSLATIGAMARILQQKIPQLSFKFISPNEIPEGVDKSANSFVKGNKVYLVTGRATTESTVEEFMHPIVYTIQQLNTYLFASLFKEAKKDFPKLWAEIQDTYTDKRGFNDINRQNELVTQALSRYVHSGYKKAQNRTTVKELVRKAFNYIAKLINNAIERIGGKAVVTPENLPKMKLSELAQLIIADDSQFKVWTTEEIQHSITSQQQKAQKISEDITKRFYVLYRAYEKMPNKSPKRQRIQNEIFETFNELKQTQDYYAVTIALDFALDNLGAWDYSANQPMKDDSISGYLWKQMNLTDPWSGITPDVLVDMYKNSIGFYDDLVSNYIPDNLDDMMSSEDKQKARDVKNLIDSVIKPMWLRAMAVVGDKIVDEIIDREVKASDQDKEDMKKVAKDWLHKNIMYGDISAVTSYIYNNSFSSNPIIKQAFHLIQDAETKTLEEMQPIGRRITKAYRKANKLFKSFGPNWQTVLMEFDRDGIPTGNFVRPINYGQYEKDLTEFTKQLNEEFKQTYGWSYRDDSTGMIVNSLTGELADNEEWGPNGEEPVYIKYLKRIEEFKCERANRRYTYAYYKERMSRPYKGSIDPNDVDVNKYGHGLSPKTLARYNYIQSNINYYLDLCTDPDTGFSYPERLSIEDKSKLDDWYYELEKLSNPYNEDATPKTDDERQMAFEIRAWQKWIGGKLHSNIDMDAFNREYDRVVEEANRTGNQRLIFDFFKYNSQLGINPAFVEQTLGQFPQVEDDDQATIHAKLLKTSLQNLVKTQKGYTRDLEKMENQPSFWLDCKHTDQIIEDGKTPQSKEFAEMFEENFTFEEILYRDANGFTIDANGNPVKPEDEGLHNDLLTYQNYMINKYTNLALVSPSHTIPGLNDSNGNPIVFNGTPEEVIEVMSKLFSYRKENVNREGEVEIHWAPLSIFTMMVPKNTTFVNKKTGRTEKTMLYVPKGRFAEKSDRHGVYMNDQYNHHDLNAEQPKRDYYDNQEAYDAMTKDSAVKDLYDILIEEMQKAQHNYQAKNRRFNYRLPQINAHTMQIWSRITKRGLGNTLQTLYESATSVEENDEAMRTSDDYITNPDGTIATDVPLKFVRKLKHPENITTDIAGSVILFANMAINFKNKTAIDAQLKTLRYNLDYENRQALYRSTSKEDQDELSPFDNENSVTMFDSMLNKHVYGNQWSANPNQPQSMESGTTQTNPWKTMLNSTLISTASFGATGALWGMLIGAPGTGAIIGGSIGAGLGLLNGAIQSGLLEGVAFFKTMKNIQRLETTQTLALNMFSMLVGFGDSTTRIFKESLMGKYMTIRDTLIAFCSVLRYTPQCLANIGNPLANNKLTRAMQLNGISKGIHQTYEHLNYGRFRRIFTNLLMGGFSLLDWMANALLMRSFYNNIRFYNGNVVPKGFYSRYELEQAFLKAGQSKFKAKLAHMRSTQTLWGAYDSNMELKPEWEPYVNQEIKTRVRTKTLKRGALYNGMNPDNDIPRWKQDLIGSVVGALRAWLAQATQHLVAGGTDNIVREVVNEQVENTEGTKTKSSTKRKFAPMTDEQRSRAMAWDYETGTPQDQIWIGIFRSFKTLGKKLQRLALLDYQGSKSAKFSPVEKYAWKDAIIYLGVLGAMMFGWIFIHDWASDVPEPKDRYHAAPEGLSPAEIYEYLSEVYIPNEYYKLQIDNTAFRIIEAQITSIDPSSAADVVNSVTALKNGLGEHLGVIKPLADISGASGHSIDEINKQGSYKFYTRGARALYKFVGPLDNLHTAFTYYGITENMKFYTNTYGGIYRAFGYDFKKEQPKKTKKQESATGFGGDTGFGGTGFSGGTGF